MLLVPTDFSPCADQAVDRAIRMAKEQQKSVLFLHVIVPPSYAFDLEVGYPLLNETLRPAAQRHLDELVETARTAGVIAERLVFEGIPSVKIIETAKERKAEMILMGTHGRTGLSRFLIGSTTEEVVRQAPCPVLVIRDTGHDPARQNPTEEMIEPTAGIIPPTASTPTAAAQTVAFKRCVLCGQPTAQIAETVICQTCMIKVEAEAREAKRRIERAGQAGTGRR